MSAPIVELRDYFWLYLASSLLSLVNLRWGLGIYSLWGLHKFLSSLPAKQRKVGGWGVSVNLEGSQNSFSPEPFLWKFKNLTDFLSVWSQPVPCHWNHKYSSFQDLVLRSPYFFACLPPPTHPMTPCLVLTLKRDSLRPSGFHGKALLLVWYSLKVWVLVGFLSLSSGN